MPDVTTNISTLSKGVTDLARDAAYVAVGLGVLAYQRAQVQRVELQKRLQKDLPIDQRIGDVRQGVAKGYEQIDDLAESAVQFVETHAAAHRGPAARVGDADHDQGARAGA